MAQPLFGELAVQLGFLTSEQLRRALEVQQEEDAGAAPHRPLGLICMQEGFLTFDQVVTILGRQARQPAAPR